MPIVNRYVPSPISDLHLGNLRAMSTGRLLTRREGGRWLLRVEDLDVVRVRVAGGAADRQPSGLRRLGMTWDGEVVAQSERLDVYRDSPTRLQDRTYECFCTRKGIEQAISAPHGEDHRPYPGTYTRLSATERARRRRQRPATIRIRAEGARFTVTNRFADEVTGVVDDFVLIRGGGVPAYNFAAVVGDLHQGVNRITRGANLLDSAPRQAWLATLLDGRPPSCAHIGLITNPARGRLAKCDGAVTLTDLLDRDWQIPEVLVELTASLGLERHETPEGALAVMPEPPLDTFCAPVTWTGNGFANSATTLP